LEEKNSYEYSLNLKAIV